MKIDRKKVAENIVQQKRVTDVNSRHAEEIFFFVREKSRNIELIKISITKYNIFKYLNH